MALQQLIVATDLFRGLVDHKKEGDDTPHLQAAGSSPGRHPDSVNESDLNNGSLGGVAKSTVVYANTSSLKSEGEADMTCGTSLLKVPTIDKSNAPCLNYANSWLANNNARPPTRVEVTKSFNCPQVLQNDMQKIAAGGKPMENISDADCQQHLKQKGLMLHKASGMLKVISAEQEATCRSSWEAPVSFQACHAVENVVKGCLSLKDSEFCDSNKAGNMHKRQSDGNQLMHIYGESGKHNSSADQVNHIQAMPRSSSCHHTSKNQVLSNSDVTVPLSSMQEAGGTLPFNSPGTTCAQLTLFYAGTVNVYDNVPADKAQEIMRLAHAGGLLSGKLVNTPAMHVLSTTITASSFNIPAFPAPRPPLPCNVHHLERQHPLQKLQVNMHGTQSATEVVLASAVPAENKKQELSNVLSPCQSLVPRALPQARKASFARFLEKRKERVRSMAPYLTTDFNKDLAHNKGKTLSTANLAGTFYTGILGSHAEDILGKKCKLLDDKITMHHGATLCEMDVEDQNWLSIGDNSKHILEAETATQFSSSSA